VCDSVNRVVWMGGFPCPTLHPSPLVAGGAGGGRATPHPSPLPARRGEGTGGRLWKAALRASPTRRSGFHTRPAAVESRPTVLSAGRGGGRLWKAALRASPTRRSGFHTRPAAMESRPTVLSAGRGDGRAAMESRPTVLSAGRGGGRLWKAALRFCRRGEGTGGRLWKAALRASPTRRLGFHTRPWSLAAMESRPTVLSAGRGGGRVAMESRPTGFATRGGGLPVPRPFAWIRVIRGYDSAGSLGAMVVGERGDEVGKTARG